MSNYKLSLVTILSVILILGCVTVPTHRTWRPWMRTLSTQSEIPIGTALSVSVSGKTHALLGSEDLVFVELKSEIIDLLERRGFVVSDSSPQHELVLIYGTERVEKQQISSSNLTVDYLTSVTGSSTGLGVSIAQAVSAASLKSLTAQEQSIETSIEYSHSVAIEIRGANQQLIWKGESTWDTPNLDVTTSIQLAMKLLISALPRDESHRSRVFEVKQSHTLNYFELYCLGRWFACPALPFRISFRTDRLPEETSRRRFDKDNEPREISLLEEVDEESALAAYVDLITNAEYALPLGDKNWEKPIRLELWKKVRLGGSYTLVPSEREINVLIDLSGKSSGYEIKKAWIATDKEWREFHSRMDDWRTALVNFYDVFEK